MASSKSSSIPASGPDSLEPPPIEDVEDGDGGVAPTVGGIPASDGDWICPEAE